MARRRKGLAIDGWLVLDKPAGLTSTQAVAKARWALRAQKAGHAGTLDPLATGLLAVAFGEATKTVPHAQEGLKTYRFTMRLGQATTTDDAEGTILAERPKRPSDGEIESALPAFRDAIEQVPPQFSAVKVEGERAYDLARQGTRLDLAPRPLWVERLELAARPDPDHAVLELVCGKGGYVRSLARDLGEMLGCLAHVVDLRRTASGAFCLDEALPVSGLEAIREGAPAPLLPVAAGLAEVTEISVRAEDAARLRNGQPACVAASLDYGSTAWASHAGTPVAICTYRGGHLHPERVLRSAA
ncbi:MAG: tRNA pseudouridine(55) synthase TruB [Pseudomonadota bacterium]